METLGLYDDFFEIGGNSLLMLRLMARIQELFRVRVAEHELFRARTIASQCEVLLALESQAGQAEKIARLSNNLAAMSDHEVRIALEGKRGSR